MVLIGYEGKKGLGLTTLEKQEAQGMNHELIRRYNDMLKSLIVNYGHNSKKIKELVLAKRQKLRMIINDYGALELVYLDLTRISMKFDD